MRDGSDDEGSWWDDAPPPEPPVDLPEDPEPEDVDALNEVVRLDRGHNSLEGHRALWILRELATTTPVGGISAVDLVAGEIGPALGIGSGAALSLVHVSVALHRRLPTTLRAVCDGDLSWYKAAKLAELTAPLTDEQAREVEAKTLPKAAERSPARHVDAIRRAVAQVDPEGADQRRKQQRHDVRMMRFHDDSGMGQLIAHLPSEQLDTIWGGCDFWARNRKAAGDTRTLDQLRVAALTQCGQSLMHHGDPEYCLRWCPPGSHGGPVPEDDANGDGPDGDEPEGDEPERDEPDGDEPDGHADEARPPSRPPRRHGRPAALHALWDLTSLLGLTRHCGELTDSGAMLPPGAMAELVAGGVKIRRMLIDPARGELVDLTPRTWTIPRTRRTELDAPVVLGVVIPVHMWRAIQDGSADGKLLDAIARAPQAVRDLLEHPETSDQLDDGPDAYPAPARLAEFIAMRDRHPTNPTAGPTAASAADVEHVRAASRGGATTRANLTYNVRRWHLLKTHGGWTVQGHGRGWKWTSPRGRVYYTQPYDYRLGP